MKTKIIVVLLSGAALLLGACTQSKPGWHWEHPQNPGPAQLYRDRDDCMYYASITDPRAFGDDKPIHVFEWDEGVRECMAKRGWIFVDPQAK